MALSVDTSFLSLILLFFLFLGVLAKFVIVSSAVEKGGNVQRLKIIVFSRWEKIQKSR